jgi:hypothetical protein
MRSYKMSFFHVVKDIRDLIPDKSIKSEITILYGTFCYRAPELINNSVLDLHAFLKKNINPETSGGQQIQKKWNDFINLFNRGVTDDEYKMFVHDFAVSFVDNMCNDIVTKMVSIKIYKDYERMHTMNFSKM